MPTKKMKEAPKAPSMVKPKTGRDPNKQKTKKQAGYYSTGPGEHKEYTTGGQKVRLGPNSSVAPAPKVGVLDKILNVFKKKKKPGEGNFGGVRG